MILLPSLTFHTSYPNKTSHFFKLTKPKISKLYIFYCMMSFITVLFLQVQIPATSYKHI